MSLQHEISQRDLRLRSREIMDAVEHGETFTVTRDGRQIAELVPIRRRQFVPVKKFLALGKGLPAIDPDAFRADLDALMDPSGNDPYDR